MIFSPFRYPGAKNKLLPILRQHIDEVASWEHFCDAFVGGGCVLLDVASRYPKMKLWVNDKDYWMSSFWKVVSRRDDKQMLQLLKLMEQYPTLEHFYKLKETPATDEVEAAYRAVFFNRTTFSGILTSGPIGGKDQKSQYTVDCRWNYNKLKEKILACHKLLAERTEVDCKDFKHYYPLTNSNYPTYIDPPYYHKGDALYPERMTDEDHKYLANILNGRPNWILSYDDCPEIRKLYSNNTIIDLNTRYCINGKKETWVNKGELLILP
jgi:DNA adenine methylase